MVNMMIDDAVNTNKELHVATLDFKDEFDSVTHDSIEYSVICADFNESIMKIMANSY
jgi:hypothetical protein